MVQTEQKTAKHPTTERNVWWRRRGWWIIWIALFLAPISMILDDLGLIRTGFGEKTLWDWLDLLIIPAVLAIGGYLFTRSENQATRATAEKRAQDEALQAYLDHVGGLLLDEKLRDPEEGGEARTLARARTVTAFKRLDAEHNRSILFFLRDSKLVGAPDEPGLSFGGTDLSGAALQGTDLSRGDLHNAILEGADLRGAVLSEATLRGADLQGANLRGANLSHCDLSGAVLSEASLRNADLSDAVLTEADLTNTDLSDSTLRGAHLSSADLRHANCRDADLSGADLRNTKLYGANLRGATLSDAVLHNTWVFAADFSRADLSGADLSGAEIVNIAGLLRGIDSLEGATMPNGEKYEDWLKSTGRGEGGENGGPS